MKEVREDEVMNINFFIDRLKSFFQYQENYSSQVYLQETEMSTKYYMKKFNHIYGIKVKILEAETTARFTMK